MRAEQKSISRQDGIIKKSSLVTLTETTRERQLTISKSGMKQFRTAFAVSE
jgi:hypothetical protein